MADRYNIGMVGYGFMGRAHGHAYLDLPAFFPDHPTPVRKVICGRDATALGEVARSFGWERTTTDWHQLVDDPDVDVVDIAAPGNQHHAIALAAARAGKPVICEKPLANSVREAREMLEAVEDAGVAHMVVFNYRYVPAVQLARALVQAGRLGEIRHIRAHFLQDWIVDPAFPLVWRLRREAAGSGALGDLGAHVVDMARFLVGEFEALTAATATFVRERPLTGPSGGDASGEVTVDDAAIFIARLSGGVLGTFEVTRFAPGHRCTNAFEVNGSRGSVRFDFERMNELQVYFTDDPPDVQGFRRINANDAAHPYAGRWWPAGHGIGYEVTFVHQLADFLLALRDGRRPRPDFADGVRCQEVLDAVERSAAASEWVRPHATPAARQ